MSNKIEISARAIAGTLAVALWVAAGSAWAADGTRPARLWHRVFYGVKDRLPGILPMPDWASRKSIEAAALAAPGLAKAEIDKVTSKIVRVGPEERVYWVTAETSLGRRRIAVDVGKVGNLRDLYWHATAVGSWKKPR